MKKYINTSRFYKSKANRRRNEHRKIAWAVGTSTNNYNRMIEDTRRHQPHCRPFKFVFRPLGAVRQSWSPNRNLIHEPGHVSYFHWFCTNIFLRCCYITPTPKNNINVRFIILPPRGLYMTSLLFSNLLPKSNQCFFCVRKYFFSSNWLYGRFEQKLDVSCLCIGRCILSVTRQFCDCNQN